MANDVEREAVGVDGPTDERRRVGALTFEELTAGLVWPHLLRSLGYSLHPGRVLLGAVGAFLVFGVSWVIDESVRSGGGPVTAFTAAGEVWPTGGRLPLGERLAGVVEAGGVNGWTVGLMLLLVLPVVGVVGTAIGRCVAADFCVGRTVTTLAGLRFALGRWRSVLVFSFAAPVLVVLLWLMLRLMSLVFFRLDFTAVIGAVLYPVAIVAAFVAVLVSLAYGLSLLMMPGALAVEDTDGVDAAERSMAYVANNLVRYAVYVAGLGVLLALAYQGVQFVVRATLLVAAGGTDAVGMATAMGLAEVDGGDGTPVRTSIVVFWQQMVWLVFIGWVLSFVSSAGVMLYLCMRRVNDAQDVRDMSAVVG